MPRRHRPTQLRGRHCFVVLAAIVGLLALPVEYRGGAASPHAHAAYQLWHDAAHGSVAHHHVGGERRPEPADSLPSARSVAGPVGAAAAEDVPRVVEVSIGATKIPLLVVIAAILLVSSIRRRLVWPVPRSLSGRGLPPETPPPRPLPVFA